MTRESGETFLLQIKKAKIDFGQEKIEKRCYCNKSLLKIFMFAYCAAGMIYGMIYQCNVPCYCMMYDTLRQHHVYKRTRTYPAFILSFGLTYFWRVFFKAYNIRTITLQNAAAVLKLKSVYAICM
ncbi:hypothetical protein LOAG_11335 [Loa loa]|uniref:Uncharacterized protein n=1 Tax=Loa loa TaxID=7209 RepID=A0A1S0TNQ1_LOALO|nr:hypothetical protein LOAG_11335 [Loa loa]EFO17167.1 hypothetical protein LOAG_11335 [Loa loa]